MIILREEQDSFQDEVEQATKEGFEHLQMICQEFMDDGGIDQMILEYANEQHCDFIVLDFEDLQPKGGSNKPFISPSILQQAICPVILAK